MHVSLVGINHETAPITIREKAAIRAGKLHDSLSLLRSSVSQGIILSTCNRTEVYSIDSYGLNTEETIIKFLKIYLNMPDDDCCQYLYRYTDEVAMEHLFRVTSGLESMIIGEFEILGQVKYALEVAEEMGMVNLQLRHMFQSAIRISRRIREETGISKNALSISSVAVDLAAKYVGDLGNCKMLVIGAGQAGRLVAKAAKDMGTAQILVASRTKERASTLAAITDGIPINLNNSIDELKTCNIVVTCADAPHRMLDVQHVEEVMRNRPELPLVIIDIAVPRNVEPEVKQINNVVLYNIDDLTRISELNRRQREGEIHKAEKIIAAEVAMLASYKQAFKVRPVVSALMMKAEMIRSAQLNKTLKKLQQLSDEEQEWLDAMTKSIVTKILKDPIQFLKTNGDSNQNYNDIVCRLFQLDMEKRR